MKKQVLFTEYELNVFTSIFSRTLLKHSLSPFEQAIVVHNFQPFYYLIQSRQVYISRSAIQQMLHHMTGRFEVLFEQDNKEKNCRHLKLTPELFEVLDDPAELLALPQVLKDKLFEIECTTLYSLVIPGVRFFETNPAFNSRDLKVIRELFDKHGLGKLFR